MPGLGTWCSFEGHRTVIASPRYRQKGLKVRGKTKRLRKEEGDGANVHIEGSVTTMISGAFHGNYFTRHSVINRVSLEREQVLPSKSKNRTAYGLWWPFRVECAENMGLASNKPEFTSQLCSF